MARLASLALALLLPLTSWSQGPSPRPVVQEVRLEGPQVPEASGLIQGLKGAPLSPQALRQVIRGLYRQDLFANVKVYSRPVPGGLELTFLLTPKLTIRRIFFAGNEAIDSERLQRALDRATGDILPEGEERRIVQVIRGMYREVGYREAQVKVDRLAVPDDPMKVDIRATVEEGEPTRIARLRFVGDLVLPQAFLRSRLSSRWGDIYDQRVLIEDMERLKELYRSHNYLEARIFEPQVEEVPQSREVRVDFRIEAGKRFKFRFEGKPLFSDKELVAALRLQDEGRITSAVLQALRQRLSYFYRTRGFLHVRLALDQEDQPRVRVLTFKIRPGQAVTVEDITFQGNDHIKSDVLREQLLSQVAEAFPQAAFFQSVDGAIINEVGVVSGVRERFKGEREYAPSLVQDPTSVYVKEVYDEAVAGLVDLYKSRGFLACQIEPPAIAMNRRGNRVSVLIRVHEGTQTRLGHVTFEGATRYSPSSLARLLLLTAEGPLDTWKVEYASRRLIKLYEQDGYIFVKVHYDIDFTPDYSRANLRFRITEGVKATVGGIRVSGQDRTREGVILDRVDMKGGDIITPESLQRNQQNVMALGLFQKVSIQVVDKDREEPVKDLLVMVKEKEPGLLELGPGLSSDDGVRAFLELTYANLGGYALQAVARLRANYPVFMALQDQYLDRSFLDTLEGKLTLGLHYPRIYGIPIPVGVGMDIILEQQSDISFNLRRVSGLATSQLEILKGLNFTLQYEVEFSDLVLFGVDKAQLEASGLTYLEKQRLSRIPEGMSLIGSLRPILSLDYRDNPFNPRRGLFASVTLEYSRSLGIEENLVDFLKTWGTVSAYFPLPRNVSIAVLLGGGVILPLGRMKLIETPEHRRFFLGGRETVRGFAEDGILPVGQPLYIPPYISYGGNLMLYMKGELRFPILSWLEGGVFFDAGNLWLLPDRFNPTDLRPSAGLALRIPTPVGPISLDYGIKLDRRDDLGEGFGAFHFSIGTF